MAKKIFGLAAVEMGPIEADGGMSLSLTPVGETVSGTATMTQEDNTTTNFTIEESDSPIESFISEVGAITFAWSSYKIDAATLYKFFGGTVTDYAAAGRILTLGSITAGSAYTNGTYNNVALTGGTGTGATANVTVAGAVVSAVTIVNRGSGYTPGNTLSVAPSSVGGTGTGFSIPVSTVGVLVNEMWEAPDSFPDVEASLKLTDKKGNIIKLPRVKIASKMNISFSKESLGQLDMVATVLQPTKVAEKRITFTLAN
jgi:hypothetical protein